MAIVKTTVKGQIVIPSELRKKYHISKGTRIKIMDRDGEIVIKPLMTNPVEEAKGIFKEGRSALEALLSGRAEDVKQ
jgi:AbrB family looped-hinge helix DNA binding protein